MFLSKGMVLKHKNSLDCAIYIERISYFGPDYVKLKVDWVNLGENMYKLTESGKKIKSPYFLKYQQKIKINMSDFCNWILVDL